MHRVSQTRYGGSDDPPEQRGDCFGSAVASLLEIPLAESFDPFTGSERSWYFRFVRWAKEHGWTVDYRYRPIAKLGLAAVRSPRLWNPRTRDLHEVVAWGWDVLWDPNAYNRWANPRYLTPNAELGEFMYLDWIGEGRAPVSMYRHPRRQPLGVIRFPT